MHILIINLVHWSTVQYVLIPKCWILRIFREMPRSTIRIVKPRGPELLSTSGLSLVRMMKEMTFLRLSSAGSTVPNGK